MITLLAQVLGWSQFLFTQVLPAISSGQLPHGTGGWLAFVGSILTGAAVHTAAKTDGTK